MGLFHEDASTLGMYKVSLDVTIQGIAHNKLLPFKAYCWVKL